MDAATKRRVRFIIVQLVYEKHERQEHRFNDVLLAGGLARLKYDIHVNMVRTLLQDLFDRGLVSYEEMKDSESGKVSIDKIKLTPEGRTLVEDNERNPLAEVK